MAKVDIDLVANVQGATKTIQKFAGQASRAVNGISDSFLNLKTLAAGAIAGIGFSRLVAAAAEQEQAVQKLNTALALSGELSVENTKDFLDFASALQANSTIGDEVSLGLVGLAKSFGASNEQAKQILQTAADLSAVTGESLESSVRNLSKTLGGLKGELGETQPELRGLTKEQLQNGEAITILAQKYEGAAKALTKTFSGAVTQTTNTFGDLLEELGEFITSNPAVIASINLAGEVFAELGKIIDDNREGFSGFVENGLKLIVDFIPSAIRLLGNFINGVQAIKLAFDGARIAVSFAVEGILGAVDLLLEGFEDLVRGALDPFVERVNVATEAFRRIGFISDETAGAITSTIGGIADFADTAGSSLDSTLSKVREFREGAQESFDSTATSIVETTKTFEDIATETEGYSARLETLIEEANKSDESLKRLSDTNRNLSAESIKAAQDLRVEAETLKEVENNAKDAKKNLDTLSLQPIELEVKPKVLKPDEGELPKGPLVVDVIPNILEPGAITTLLDPKNVLPAPAEPSFLEQFSKDFGAGVDRLKNSVGGAFDLSVENFANAANTLLGGAEGAKQFLQQGSALVADAFLPGLGQAVGPLVGALSQGPEFVREQVTAFAEAIPDLLNAIAEAFPVLIDVLADKAPEIIVALVKAAPAISRAIIIGLARLPFILAQEFASEFAGILDEVFGTSLQTDFDAAAERFAGITEDLQEKYLSSVQDGVTRTTSTLKDGLNAFTSGFQSFFNGIVGGIKTSFADIGAGFEANLAKPAEALQAFIGGLSEFDFGSSFIEKFQFLLNDLTTFSFPEIPALEAPEIVLPPFPELKIPDLKGILNAPFNTVIDLLNSLKIPELRASGKILGRRFDAVILPETDLIPGDIPRLQAGGRVPEGFPNDNFIAGLQSNEEVLDTSTSEQLRNFLDEQEQGRDVNIILQIGEKQLADVLVNINRQGFRVTP